MPSKVVAPASPVVSVKKLLLELETDSTSFITLRVKPDRRQMQLDLPVAFERRVARQTSYHKKPASSYAAGLPQ